jgi:hypothetical protein
LLLRKKAGAELDVIFVENEERAASIAHIISDEHEEENGGSGAGGARDAVKIRRDYIHTFHQNLDNVVLIHH